MTYRVTDVVWGDGPGAGLPVLIPLVKALPGVNVYFHALTDKWESVYTHFYLGRTVPCIGQKRGCVCQEVTISRRWKAYIPGWDAEQERLVLAEITRDAARKAESEWMGPKTKLRGKRLCLRRIGKGERSPARLDLAVSKPLEYDLPAGFSVRDALIRLWNGGGRK